MDINPAVEPDIVGSMTAIAALDMLCGLRNALAAGNERMAHRCGFTLEVLLTTLRACDFAAYADRARPEYYVLWVVACPIACDDSLLRRRAARHFPPHLPGSG